MTISNNRENSSHHSSNVNPVDFFFAWNSYFPQGDISQSHPCAEVEERCQGMVGNVLHKHTHILNNNITIWLQPNSLLLMFHLFFLSYSSSPARAVLMTPSREDRHTEEGHNEAEDRDKHHPAQRVWWVHMGRSHQDPNQTTKNLQ